MGKIVHIVLFKLAKAPATITSAADLAAYRTKVVEPFKQLVGVPGVLTGHVGPPKIADRAKGYDLGFYSVFESAEALQKYAVSEEHMSIVIGHIRPNTEDILAYDFELPDDQ